MVIVLAAAETKEKKADDRCVPNILTKSIDRYVNGYRNILAGGDESPALWLSTDSGNAMGMARSLLRLRTLL